MHQSLTTALTSWMDLRSAKKAEPKLNSGKRSVWCQPAIITPELAGYYIGELEAFVFRTLDAALAKARQGLVSLHTQHEGTEVSEWIQDPPNAPRGSWAIYVYAYGPWTSRYERERKILDAKKKDFAEVAAEQAKGPSVEEKLEALKEEAIKREMEK